MRNTLNRTHKDKKKTSLVDHRAGEIFIPVYSRMLNWVEIFPYGLDSGNKSVTILICFHLYFQAVVLITDGSSVMYPQGLASISKSLKEAGIKVVVVVVGDAHKGLENVRPLASADKFILAVGSPDRLKIKVQEAVDKIMQGDLYNAVTVPANKKKLLRKRACPECFPVCAHTQHWLRKHFLFPRNKKILFPRKK